MLPQSRVREFLGKQVSEQPRYRAGLIPHRSNCVYGRGPCRLDLAPTGFSEWDLGCISRAWNSSLYSILAGSPWFYLLHSVFMWVGDMLGKVVSRKMCGPLDSRESMQVLGSALPGVRIPKTPWLRLSERPWDHKPLRRQSLCPWRGHCPCPIYFTLLDPEPDQLANDGQDSSREG